jgi:hypothetical protein
LKRRLWFGIKWFFTEILFLRIAVCIFPVTVFGYSDSWLTRPVGEGGLPVRGVPFPVGFFGIDFLFYGIDT